MNDGDLPYFILLAWIFGTLADYGMVLCLSDNNSISRGLLILGPLVGWAVAWIVLAFVIVAGPPVSIVIGLISLEEEHGVFSRPWGALVRFFKAPVITFELRRP